MRVAIAVPAPKGNAQLATTRWTQPASSTWRAHRHRGPTAHSLMEEIRLMAHRLSRSMTCSAREPQFGPPCRSDSTMCRNVHRACLIAGPALVARRQAGRNAGVSIHGRRASHQTNCRMLCRCRSAPSLSPWASPSAQGCSGPWGSEAASLLPLAAPCPGQALRVQLLVFGGSPKPRPLSIQGRGIYAHARFPQ